MFPSVPKKYPCHYCARELAVPCLNGRDMEDSICELDDETCYQALKALGGGERGLDYIDKARQLHRTLDAQSQSQPQKDPRE